MRPTSILRMRPTQILRSGGGGDTPLGKFNTYIGNYGGFGPESQKQRGIISYGLAPNRQNPWAHAGHDAIFNTWRRFSRQVLYWAPVYLGAYYVVGWAVEKNEHVNSKAGRAELAEEEEE